VLKLRRTFITATFYYVRRIQDYTVYPILVKSKFIQINRIEKFLRFTRNISFQLAHFLCFYILKVYLLRYVGYNQPIIIPLQETFFQNISS